MGEYTLAQLELFYNEALIEQDKEVARIARAVRIANQKTKDFTKSLKILEGDPKK